MAIVLWALMAILGWAMAPAAVQPDVLVAVLPPPEESAGGAQRQTANPWDAEGFWSSYPDLHDADGWDVSVHGQQRRDAEGNWWAARNFEGTDWQQYDRRLVEGYSTRDEWVNVRGAGTFIPAGSYIIGLGSWDVQWWGPHDPGNPRKADPWWP